MRVLDPVMESLPDQGIEKQSKDGRGKPKRTKKQAKSKA